MVALVIPVFNRPEYLKLCFDSIERLTAWPDMIVIVDDCSADNKTRLIVASYATKFIKSTDNIFLIGNEKNLGIKGTLQKGIEKAIEKGATTIINLDSDAIVTPDFVERLVALKEGHSTDIVSGFNCVTEINYVAAEFEDCVLKPYLNGINMCFNVAEYYDHIKPALQSPGNWDYTISTGQNSRAGFLVTKPSCVQHIGMVSSMGHSGNGQVPDVAQDFPAEYMPKEFKVRYDAVFEVKEPLKISGFPFGQEDVRIGTMEEYNKPLWLPQVTLFGIDAHNQNGITRAAEICERNIHFGAVKIITERLFPGATMKEGRENYSRFIIKELYKHFETSHVLIIHSDGYVQNWEAWKDEWLQYDLIGATWSYKDGKNVGNGGFSLRSQRLCHILAIDEKIKDLHPEDDRIARQYRPYLEEKYGIKFAPEEVANQFSIEAYGSHVFTDSSGINAAEYSNQFGFHGNHVRGLKIPLR